MSRARHTQHVTEVLQGFPDAQVRITQHFTEVLQAYTAGVAPTGSFGVAVTNRLTELLMGVAADVRVQNFVTEVLWQDGSETGGTGGTQSYGFAV